MNEYVKKSYICSVCGTTFTLGRGRPPRVAYCAAHKPATIAQAAPAAPKNIRKVDSPSDITKSATGDIHGHRPNGPAITEPCPNCFYAYADGGFCPDCGWMKPINRLPYGTATGPSKKEK